MDPYYGTFKTRDLSYRKMFTEPMEIRQSFEN